MKRRFIPLAVALLGLAITGRPAIAADGPMLIGSDGITGGEVLCWIGKGIPFCAGALFLIWLEYRQNTRREREKGKAR